MKFPLVTLFAAVAGLAQAAPLQLSSGNLNSFGPSLSADGSRVAFYSAGNMTGGNADNNFEVFVYERGAGQLRQITSLPGGQFAGGNQEPSLSGDGSRVVFQHFGLSGNNGYFQTLSVDLNTNVQTTLTPLGPTFEQSAISRDGQRIAVATDNLGLRLYDMAAQSFSSVVVASPLDFTLSGDGKRLAYEGFSQGVRVLDFETGITTVISPTGSGFNQRPAISADGNSVAFVSSFNPLGQNADGNAELFRYDIASHSLLQLTHTTGGTASGPSISGNGSRIVFSSTADLTGGNADGNFEAFVYDLLAGDFRQLTHTAGLAYNMDTVISEDGSTMAYVAGMDPSAGSSAAQVFIDTLGPQVGSPLPEPASLALVLAALGLLPVARRLRA
ncbi:MAG: PD40 domain-containing protein [Burkholderiales bacterium]|nr:PD40 domain-containing protein [Burkholderiales bacterium]